MVAWVKGEEHSSLNCSFFFVSCQPVRIHFYDTTVRKMFKLVNKRFFHYKKDIQRKPVGRAGFSLLAKSWLRKS